MSYNIYNIARINTNARPASKAFMDVIKFNRLAGFIASSIRVDYTTPRHYRVSTMVEAMRRLVHTLGSLQLLPL